MLKDLRKPGSTSTYAVAFVARAGGVGHAFVIIGHNDEQKKACVSEAFGFYPGPDGKGVFAPVPGKLVNEYLEKTGAWKAGTYLIVRIEQTEYQKVEAVMKKWATANSTGSWRPTVLASRAKSPRHWV